jgi:sirohydrochlorin ferrochelatase
MLAPGRHVSEDIPALAAAAAARHPGVSYRVTEPLGVDPRIAAVVVDRVESSTRKPTAE